MIDAKQLARFSMSACVRGTVRQGAKLEAGGTFGGLRLRTHGAVLGEAGHVASVDDEPFGPLVNLVTFNSDEEAIALANPGQGGAVGRGHQP